jgi:hypothetical protein
MAGKHHWNGKYWYVDSDFLNSLRSVFPGAELEHMGFGEFFMEVPGKGRIDFDRMRGEDFDGQVGREAKLRGTQIQKGSMTMDNVRIARRLLFMAKELIGIDFPTQDAYDKYMKEHPDADKTNHRVVETKKDAPKQEEPAKKDESKAEPKSLKDFGDDSDKYHVDAVLPALKHTLKKHIPEGVKLRGSGRKIKKHLELIADIDRGDGDTLPVQIDIHGSYMTDGDGNYEIRVHSPYIQGDHTYHESFDGDPSKDAESISKDMGELLEDFKGFVLQKYGKKK